MSISDSLISDNSAEKNGGALWTVGEMTVSNSVLSGNAAGRNAGGVLNDGFLSIDNSTLSENSAGRSGGGVFNTRDDDAVVVINESTLSGNVAAEAGGAFWNQTSLTINNSTLSGNTAKFGGGIVNFGHVVINHCTLSGNAAEQFGGGILNVGAQEVIGQVDAKNSIVANSPSGGDCVNEGEVDIEGTMTPFEGSFTASGDNLDTDGTCPGFTQVTPDALSLGPLTDNGGVTKTHALLPGSVALDAVTDCTMVGGDEVTTDQRAVERPQGTACDIGAFELEDE